MCIRDRAVDRSAVRAVDDHAPVAELVAEALDEQGAVVGYVTRRLALLSQVAEQVVRRPFVEACGPDTLSRGFRPQPGHLADESPNRGAELGRAPERVTLPERQPRGHAGSGCDEYAIVGDVLDPPRRRTEREHVAHPRLVHHLLVQLAHPTARRLGTRRVPSRLAVGWASWTRRWCTSRGWATCSRSVRRRGGSRTSPTTAYSSRPLPACPRGSRSGRVTRSGALPSSAPRSGGSSARWPGWRRSPRESGCGPPASTNGRRTTCSATSTSSARRRVTYPTTAPCSSSASATSSATGAWSSTARTALRSTARGLWRWRPGCVRRTGSTSKRCRPTTASCCGCPTPRRTPGCTGWTTVAPRSTRPSCSTRSCSIPMR